MTKVKFHYAGVRLNYNRKTALRRFVENLFEREKMKLDQLDYIFCSDEYLIQINQQHLNHDTYTDIITFDLSLNKQSGIVGEVYISVDRVKENALKFSVPFSEELERVVFHGALHLCGYKDKKGEDVLIMREMEDWYIKLFT